MFQINSITARTHDTSYGGYKWKITVSVSVDAKAWTKARNKKQLGSLYGVDISNAVHRINSNIPAWNPMVSDRARAKNGMKTITLEYFTNDPIQAKGLGLDTSLVARDGVVPKFADYVTVYKHSDACAPCAAREFKLIQGGAK